MSALRSCIEQLYIEVFPVAGIEEKLLALPKGSHIGVTCSPKQGLETTLQLVDSLQGRDFHLVPHIAARQVRDPAHLRDITQRLEAQGIRALFVPGGDIDSPVGAFDSSLQLLREMANIGHNFLHVGVAAYPDGHPAIDNETLFQALLAKQELATYFVTQMCFDVARIESWLRSMRDRGVILPAWIGLPGVIDRMKLFRTSLRIGVGESARFARKQTSLAGKLLRSSRFRPDELVTGLEPCIDEPELGIGGFYLFSFNQLQETIAWRAQLMQHFGARQSVAGA